MRVLRQIRELFNAAPAPDGPRIAVFGDSHTAALLRAAEPPQRQHHYEHIRVVRLRKEKDGKIVGHSDLASFCREIRHFGQSDFVFSAVGGNQYAVLSTVQEPIDYDFLTSAADEDLASDSAQLVPMRAIAGYIEAGVRGTIGPVLRELREATRAQVYHLAPPPPKEDNEFIARHFESRFVQDGIHELGPTRPQLRLKCWRLQLDCLERLCGELGVGLIQPPGKSVTPEGYLKPHYYAKDVTHGNRRYGEMVLKQILKITQTAHKAEDRVP
jgi:hypothetical protein